MSKLLVIETSPRTNKSISRNLTKYFIQQWENKYPDGEIIKRDLVETNLNFITAPWLNAYFTPPELQPIAMKETLSLSDKLIEELLIADHILIATPVYNYNIPASLKAWFDYIVRKGKTIGFDGQGLIIDKKATVLLASGGLYTKDSPIHDRDIAAQYLRLILNVIGIKDISIIQGGGAKAVDLGEIKMENFINNLSSTIKAAIN